MKVLFPLFILVFTLFFSCKKRVQPDMMDVQNACDCLIKQRSTFFMGEKFGEQYIDLDTVIMPVGFGDGNPANFDYINYTYITFKANNPDALSYEWQVGNNSTSQNSKEFSLYFLDSVNQMPVRLIMTSKPNKKCIPDDDGIDTIVRYLHIKNKLPHPMWGKYYGFSSESPNDYFTIEIDTLTMYNPIWTSPYSCGEVIKNLPNGKVFPLIIGKELGSASYCIEGLGDTYPPYNDLIYVEDKSAEFNNRCRAYYNRFSKEIEIIYFTREIIDPFNLGMVYTKKIFKGKKI